MTTMMMRRAILAAAVGLAGCVSTTPEVVDVRHVSRASSRPRIDEIVDLGTAAAPDRRLTLGRGDGRGVIGELLLLRGSSFGKQPTVAIDEQPAEVVAYVAGGGIVVRVPWGIDAGQVAVRIANQRGSHQLSYPLARLAVVATGDGVTLAEVAVSGCRLLRSIAHPGAQRVAVTTEGATALVAGGRPPHLSLLDLTASPPAFGRSHRLPGERVVAVAVASHAPLGAVLTDTHLVLIDERRPGSVALYAPQELPRELRGSRLVAAALSPDGKQLAIAVSEGNRVALFDVGRPATLPSPRLLDVRPDVPLEVLVGLGFDPRGQALWVVSGDTPRSVAGGAQPTRLSQVGSLAGEPQLEGEAIEVSGVSAPTGLTVSRGVPTPPGTSIRYSAGDVALYLASHPHTLLSAAAGAVELPAGDELGRLVRLERGRPPALIARGRWAMSSVEVAGKTQIVVALAAGRSAGEVSRLLVSRKAWDDDDRPKVLRLGPLQQPLALPLTAAVGELGLQP